MNESAQASGGPGVALLFEDANLSAHLRQALVDAGARIVHEGPATQATREDLAGNGADVVVVNLDDKVEAHLDALYDIFDESRQRVVFNDAEASSGLSGWDQARWARHLAAKLLDGHDVDPPRPAEARPIEAHPTEMMLPDDEMPEAPPEDDRPAASEPVAQAGQAVDEGDLSAELEALLAEDVDLINQNVDGGATASHEKLSSVKFDEDELGEDHLDIIPDAMKGTMDTDAVEARAKGHEDADGLSATKATAPAEAESAPASGPVPESTIEAGGPKAEQLPREPVSEPTPTQASLAAADDDEDSFEETLRMFDQVMAESESSVDASEEAHADAEALFQADAEATQAPASNREELESGADELAGAGETADIADQDALMSLEDLEADAPPSESAKPAVSLPEDAGSAFSLVDPEDDSPADPTASQKKPSALSEDAGHAFSLVDPDDDSPADPTANEKKTPAISVHAGDAFSLVDPDDDSPADPGATDGKGAPSPGVPDWDLVDFDAAPDSGEPQKLETIPQNTREPAVDASEFGIEKMSASEYLSPEGEGEQADAQIEPSMSLELESPEEAIAPKVEQGDKDAVPFGANLEGHVRHAVVIAAGSSEESRSALRDFLVAVERVPDAVVLGVVHQKAGDDLEGLSRQLNQASPIMPVRVAGEDGKTRHGEMLLVPAGKQAALHVDGKLQLLNSSAQPMANPSADLTMSLLAKELGADVLAIVLAGDAIDALAGAQAIKDGGGRVWAMDPADCSDNTMVSVICEEQLAEHTGSPQDLAARMLEELS